MRARFDQLIINCFHSKQTENKMHAPPNSLMQTDPRETKTETKTGVTGVTTMTIPERER